MRNVESERLIFEIINKFQNHCDWHKKLARETETNVFRIMLGKDNHGEKWLQDVAILMLYHGTEFSPLEIAALTYGNLQKDGQIWQLSSPLKEQKITVGRESELFYILELLLKNSNSIIDRRQELDENIKWTTQKKVAPEKSLFCDSQQKTLKAGDIIAVVEKYSDQPGKRTIAPYFALSADDFAVIPTPLRINANPRYTGKGITIAFIDSGFYAHPDLTKPENRILSYVNISDPKADWGELETSDVDSWHGMQTSVSACGNGYLSQGLYRGIASDAKVVLVKVAGDSKDRDEDIARAIEWLVEHREKYNIRIINISLGCSENNPETEKRINGAIDEAVAAGIVFVAAAGNDPDKRITPPATALSAITVGGVDDQNVLFQQRLRMYHSSYGLPLENFVKPEIIAPAIWVAAPVLPGAPLYYESLALHRILQSEKKKIVALFEEYKEKLTLPKGKTLKTAKQIKQWAEQRAKDEKLLAVHYQHVDGTSFAAPITCSVIAQMLEVNSELRPRHVKKILIGTAKPLPGVPSAVQGFGLISPGDALDAAAARKVPVDEIHSPAPIIYKNHVTFEYINSEAKTVHVVGDFNQWHENNLAMIRSGDKWTATREFYFPGRYRYKLLIDGNKWIADPMNVRQEEDGYGEKNSLFAIHTPGNAEEVFDNFTKTIRMLSPADSEKRKIAFEELDNVLQSPLSNRSYRVREFYAKALRRALYEMEQDNKADKWRLWQLYNQGYVINCQNLTIGFDIVTTRHVTELYWEMGPTVVSRLADILDILFITHRHPDHLDFELVNMMINKGKKVMMPHEINSIVHRGTLGARDGDDRDFPFPSKKDQVLKVKSHKGLHVYDNGRNIPLYYYEITFSDKTRVLFLGDHDYTQKINDIEKCTLLLPKCGGVTPDLSDEQAFASLTKKLKADYVFPGHVNELGHPVKGGRISYHTAFECAKQIDIPCHILAWGESFSP